MTHNDPESVMTTTTTVKINAISVQPPSDLESMCRKYTMWTMICTKANAMIAMAVTPDDSGPLITSQNGITVNRTDRPHPTS